MKTEIIKLDINNIDADKIRYAGSVIRSGGLVAFPTETVYGLGANAMDEYSISKIFEAKGRPSDNPLIVHISDKIEINKLVKYIPANASRLMDAFWPGPLTIVMDKSDAVPSLVTAGLNTVAVRMPSHPVALALIKESGCPIAAPSANTSGKPSPTIASHVIEDLSGRVDVIIDAGNAKVGLESTVIDTTVNPPMILRPGGITPDQLKQVLCNIEIDKALWGKDAKNYQPKSPGLKYTHYSPKADVIVIEGNLSRVVEKINELIGKYKMQGLNVGVLATEQTKGYYNNAEIISSGSRYNPETIASNLFRALREFDNRNVQLILAEAINDEGIGFAVMNRLNKAAGYNIIKV